MSKSISTGMTLKLFQGTRKTKHNFDSTLQQIKALILHPQERIVVAMRKIYKNKGRCKKKVQRMGKSSMFGILFAENGLKRFLENFRDGPVNKINE